VSHFRHTTIILLISLTVLGAAALGSVAGATPIDDKQAQAAAIQDEIDSSGQRISALAEEFNGAQLRLEESQRAIADTQARIDAARAEVTRIKHLLELRAASVYRRAVRGESLDSIDYADARDLLTRRHYASKQARSDDALLDQLATAQRDLAAQKSAAEAAQSDAAAEQQRIEDARADLEGANAEQSRILEQVNGELEALVQEEARRREAEEASLARARYGGGGGAGGGGAGGGGGAAGGGGGGGSAGGGGGNPERFPDLPAPGPASAAAIEFARAQLGKPYVYAAAGPDAYDCSGLTMAAYASAGIFFPHYSGAQYSALPHVPLDSMRPGDLVFWGPGGSAHVGLYIGNGMMIHAPHTGDVVKIASVYGKPVGAARPGV
jgi:cell wall-associated NlpC family hydrolase